MIVNVLSRTLVKPCTPTPHNLRRYHVSYMDELAPPANFAVVLYYPYTSSSPSSNTEQRKLSIRQSLMKSLSRVLPHFYPLAGRYIKAERLIECNDQGVEFILADASADVQLVDVIATEQQLDRLVPRDAFFAEKFSDPLLSIQLTEFNCGGTAIGVSVSHRVIDAWSLAMLIAYWANATNHTVVASDPPNFDAPRIFPAKNFPILDLESEANQNINLPEIVAKRLFFNREAIIALKTKASISSTTSTIRSATSRVCVVTALISRALIRVHNEIQGCSKGYIICQLINLRPRTIPPLPDHSCGNLVTLAATPCISANNAENMEFVDMVGLVGDTVGKKLEDLKEILQQGEAGHAVIVNAPLSVGLGGAITGDEVNLCLFTDWSKLGFYEADFGWGKPVWASVGSTMVPNCVIFMPDREGSGIEAWVHLDKKSMSIFEQDEEIKLFITK